MLGMKKRFTVTLDAPGYAALRALAYAAEVPLAVKARDLILDGIAQAANPDSTGPDAEQS